MSKWKKLMDTCMSRPRTVLAAFRQMTSGRPGAVQLGLPIDVQKGPVDNDEIWGDRALGVFPSLRAAPSPETVEAAAAALATAERPLLICGGGDRQSVV